MGLNQNFMGSNHRLVRRSQVEFKDNVVCYHGLILHDDSFFSKRRNLSSTINKGDLLFWLKQGLTSTGLKHCNQSWPQTHGNARNSASQVLELQAQSHHARQSWLSLTANSTSAVDSFTDGKLLEGWQNALACNLYSCKLSV